MQLYIGNTPLAPACTKPVEIAGDAGDKWHDEQPFTATATMSRGDVRRLLKMGRGKWPRKTKKAVGQMWSRQQEGDTCTYTFHVLTRTKWQRRASRLIRMCGDDLMFPLKSGGFICYSNRT